MKKLILSLGLFLLLAISIHAGTKPKSYIKINPRIEVGKFQNGYSFAEVIPVRANWQLDEYFSISGSAGVGFTAPRSGSITAQNHYSNRVTIQATYRPLKRLGFFFLCNWSTTVRGHHNHDYFHNHMQYHRSHNYQSFGVEYEFIEFN